MAGKIDIKALPKYIKTTISILPALIITIIVIIVLLERVNLTAIGFVGIYVMGLFLALFRHPIFGLLTYLWAFYNHSPHRWWGSDLPDLRWSLIAALITFISLLWRKPSSTSPPWHANWSARILIIFVAWMWLQTPFALNKSYHLEGCILFTKYLLLYYIIYQILSDKKMFELFSWGHVVGCFIFSWIAYRSVASGRFEVVGAPGLEGANSVAIHLSTGLAFASFLFLGFYGKKRWVIFATIPFILNGIILTVSRGAFLGILCSIPVALYLSPKVYRRHVYGVIMLVIVLFSILSNELFWDRIATIWRTAGSDSMTQESEAKESAESRIELLRSGWKMAQDYPWGAGHRGHEVLSPEYMPAKFLSPETGVRAAHNTFMHFLVEQGYPGAILFIIILVCIASSLLRLKSLDKVGLKPLLAIYRAALGMALTVCFVSGQFSSTLKAEVQIWLIAMLSVLLNLCYESIHKETQRSYK